MTQYEREQIKIVIGMLATLEYVLTKPDGVGESVTEANDILKDLLVEDENAQQRRSN